MKFKTGLLLGIAIGYAIASRKSLTGDDEPIVRHPEDSRRGSNGIADLGRRLGESASLWSLRAIRQARGAVRDRLETTDDAAWN
ncbi:MAG TPA: hypothetical protein VJN50_04585 [Actinomycetota bacterium]|nr:hypothetical protein [Actinomycetota bacterium]